MISKQTSRKGGVRLRLKEEDCSGTSFLLKREIDQSPSSASFTTSATAPPTASAAACAAACAAPPAAAELPPTSGCASGVDKAEEATLTSAPRTPCSTAAPAAEGASGTCHGFRRRSGQLTCREQLPVPFHPTREHSRMRPPKAGPARSTSCGGDELPRSPAEQLACSARRHLRCRRLCSRRVIRNVWQQPRRVSFLHCLLQGRSWLALWVSERIQGRADNNV